MAQWKKSGHSCPQCNQETEVLVSTMGDHDGVSYNERCWRCGWVAGFHNKNRPQSLALGYDREPKKTAHGA